MRRHLRNASTACLAGATALGLPALVSLSGQLLISTHAYGWIIFAFFAPVGFALGCSFNRKLHSARRVYPLLVSAGILTLGLGCLSYFRGITLSKSRMSDDSAFHLPFLMMIGSGIYAATIGMLLIASGTLGKLSLEE